MLLLLVGGLALLNAMRTPGRPVSATPTASPPPLLPLQVASPPPATASAPPVASSPAPVTPTLPPTPTAAAAQYARIANTGGLGANLRREPATTAPPNTAVAENAVVRLIGPEQRSADGRLWRLVEDSREVQGWVPTDFLIETVAPPGR